MFNPVRQIEQSEKCTGKTRLAICVTAAVARSSVNVRILLSMTIDLTQHIWTKAEILKTSIYNALLNQGMR